VPQPEIAKLELRHRGTSPTLYPATAVHASFENADFDDLLDGLRAGTGRLDLDEAWPAEAFERLREAGVLEWVVPDEYGGNLVGEAELTRAYQLLATACLVTTFVLTQRNGACQRIAGSTNEALKAELLPGLARGELFATVGISHLTTSRQHIGTPAVVVREEGTGGFVLDGLIPWVTGGRHADIIVGGGTLADGRQILAAIPTDTPGVVPGEAARLMALNGSHTGPVELRRVRLAADRVVAGPVEGVMRQGTGGGAGSVTTSALALGAAQSSIEGLRIEAERRPDVAESFESLHAEAATLERDLYRLVERGTECGLDSEGIRRRANSLVLRAAQALLAATKGAGYVRGHAAERAVREAMFFLVWSCPQPVVRAALREFACLAE
jgi:alkylation response protein AidB-like acyl-CoA dehydrogenase